MKELEVFFIFLGVRILSVLLVQTWFVPDEYWQSLEVAHKFAFGYGYVTWEWTKGIRSYVHPIIFTLVYKILDILGLDYVELLIYFPRILQAFLSSYADLCFYKWSGTKKWAIFTMASSWFWFYTGSRTLINSFETALTTIALARFPWTGKEKSADNKFLCIVTLLFVMRPTAAIQWLPLCFYYFMTNKEKISDILSSRYNLLGMLIIGLSILIDSLAHGSFIITPFNFLKTNLFQGISSNYGSHPWHWYLSQGLPATLGIQILPFALATIHIIRNRNIYKNELVLLGAITFTIFIYSLLPHKEFRFILPILPMVFNINSGYLSKWSCKAKPILIWIVTGVILSANIVPAWYMGVVHQRGTLDVMPILRDIANGDIKNTSILFLMPCHSTPLYSHLHCNVTTKFLTCEPNLENKEKYVDEAEQFYNNPNVWLRMNYPPDGNLPSHIVTFDSLVPSIKDILSRYRPIHRIFHTSILISSKIGRNVIIHERIDLN